MANKTSHTEPVDFEIMFSANTLDKDYIIHIPFEQFPLLADVFVRALKAYGIDDAYVEIKNKK